MLAAGAGDLRGQQSWQLEPEALFTAGGAGAAADELFTRISGAVRLSDGRYVIADGAELRLSVHGRDGSLERTFGRDGEGPGEFRALSGFWHVAGDTIGVWDSRLQRITRMRADGTVVRTNPIAFGPGGAPAGSGSLDAFMGALDDGRIVLAWLAVQSPVANRLLPDRMLLGVFDARGGFERLLGSQMGMLRIVTETSSGPFVFSPFTHAAVVRDTVVFTNGLAGAIEFFDPATAGQGPVRSISAGSGTIPLGQAWDRLDAALEHADASPVMVALTRATDRSLGSVPVFSRMFSDGAGRLWLRQYDPATDAMALRRGGMRGGGRWIIVETGGRPVAHLDMPARTTPLSVYGDELVAIVRDEFDVESIAVYRIVE